LDQEADFIHSLGLLELPGHLHDWLQDNFLRLETLTQAGIIVAALLVAWLLRGSVKGVLGIPAKRTLTWDAKLHRVAEALPDLAFPIALLLLILAGRAVAEAAELPSGLLVVAISLTAAWIVIRLGAAVVQSPQTSRILAVSAWALAALNILGWLDDTIRILDGTALPFAGQRITLLVALKAAILLLLLLWLARVLTRFARGRIDRSKMLTPSMKVLIEKSLKIVVFSLVFLVTLDYLGVDLTAFAVFTGALGVGVGFGLQKVVSNLVSGFILLMDRSIKPGDVIELDETFGWVTSLGARYVALSTRDGKEWLIPNEDLITQRVVNWSYSNKLLRLPVRFGVAYHSDVRKAMELAIQAAKSEPRVLTDPAPVCRLVEFGDNSVNFELRVWIYDPEGGVMNVRSNILLALWDLLRQEEIEIPFPQRDLHIKEGSRLVVKLDKDQPDDQK
jgi:small-conductance mechanosensitive channel